MDDRYHLTLTLDGRPAMQGWWSSEAAACDQIPGWIGTWGVPGARITLVDELEGTELTTWPERL